MKRIIIVIVFCFFSVNLYAQSSIVYKRNPATGNFDVYQSSGGLPIGTPIYRVKKNVYGYLEVENVDVSTDPFTRKPDYAAYNNFKPYQLPAQQIFETLETLNKRYEFDYVTADQGRSSSNAGQEYAKKYFQKRSNVATAFFNFYNSNVSFPRTIGNGWYDVVDIFDNEGSSLLGTEPGKDYKYGVCKVQDNKIIEYYENCNVFDLKIGLVFNKIKLDVISPINNCKSIFRPATDNSYHSLYFLDNILDSTKRIPDPQFGFYSVYTSFTVSSSRMIFVQVARNKTITRQQITDLTAGPYSANLQQSNPQNTDCSNTYMTLAFKKSSDNFSIGIFQTTATFFGGPVWIMNSLTFTPGGCQSTTLNQ